VGADGEHDAEYEASRPPAWRASAAVPTRRELQHARLQLLHPAKDKIAQMQAAGAPDSTIVDDFIKAYGKGIYRSEPNTLGWLVPYLALALGTVVVIWFVRRSRRLKPALVVDARLARYNDQIEQELQNLE